MSAFRRIVGSLRMLRKRAREVCQPGLVLWTDTGENAAGQLQRGVRDKAYKAEQRARQLEADLREMTADGKIDAEEFKRLCGAPAYIHAIAEGCHDLGEAVS